MASSANPINWFEIPTNDLDRAQKFYESVLSIQMERHDLGPLQMAWFPMSPGGAGATGALVKAETYTPSYQGAVVYFSVDSIEEALKRVENNGGKTLNPKTSIGEYGFVAHFEDSEGNRVAFHAEA